MTQAQERDINRLYKKLQDYDKETLIEIIIRERIREMFWVEYFRKRNKGPH